ncbi:hypothetical protein Tco_1085997, partial [Tanacetum coccineum]
DLERAWKGDLGIGEEVVTYELEVLIVELFVDLFVVLIVELFMDLFVGLFMVVKAPVSTMIVSVPEKDRWCGARGKFVWWKGVRVTKASERANVGVRGGCTNRDQGHVTTMFELQRHQGDQDVDAKGNGLLVIRAKAEAATCKGYRSPVLSQRRRV